MNEHKPDTRAWITEVPDFVKKHEDEENTLSLSKPEIENLKNAIKGEPEESQRVMLSVFPTSLLKEELARRENILNTIIDDIKEFASSVDSTEELEAKQGKFEQFSKTMAGKLTF